MHHVSVLQQLPGTEDAVLDMRGIAEFPAFDRFTLRLPSADASIETTSGDGGVEHPGDRFSAIEPCEFCRREGGDRSQQRVRLTSGVLRSRQSRGERSRHEAENAGDSQEAAAFHHATWMR